MDGRYFRRKKFLRKNFSRILALTAKLNYAKFDSFLSFLSFHRLGITKNDLPTIRSDILRLI